MFSIEFDIQLLCLFRSKFVQWCTWQLLMIIVYWTVVTQFYSSVKSNNMSRIPVQYFSTYKMIWSIAKQRFFFLAPFVIIIVLLLVSSLILTLFYLNPSFFSSYRHILEWRENITIFEFSSPNTHTHTHTSLLSYLFCPSLISICPYIFFFLCVNSIYTQQKNRLYQEFYCLCLFYDVGPMKERKKEKEKCRSTHRSDFFFLSSTPDKCQQQ
jgi:hypothetical protein